jgi:tRNA modification GTPase
MLDDTIAAISTPPGEGGISIVRISGPEAFTFADRVFQGDIRPSESPSHRVLHGQIIDPESKTLLDDILLVVMRKPKTYTAEDVVEINCHGGILVAQRILQAVLRCGARLAEPGEFTKRAFLNGRIDLAQAEAVLDIIRSRTPMGLTKGLDQLTGKLSKKMEGLRKRLVEVLAQLEVTIDFSESDNQPIQREQLHFSLEETLKIVEILVETSETGRIIREGAKLAIVGKPNVGKSSLLNALLMEDRAIVSSVPGTTRDTIEEWLNIDGFPFKVIDTAGLGSSRDELEK